MAPKHPNQNNLPHQPSDLYDDEIDETEQSEPEIKISAEDEKKARHEEFISVISPTTKARIKANSFKNNHIIPDPANEKKYSDYHKDISKKFDAINQKARQESILDKF